jgi:hypothetical protein
VASGDLEDSVGGSAHWGRKVCEGRLGRRGLKGQLGRKGLKGRKGLPDRVIRR